jgi:hypothetical protein
MSIDGVQAALTVETERDREAGLIGVMAFVREAVDPDRFLETLYPLFLLRAAINVKYLT